MSDFKNSKFTTTIEKLAIQEKATFNEYCAVPDPGLHSTDPLQTPGWGGRYGYPFTPTITLVGLSSLRSGGAKAAGVIV